MPCAKAISRTPTVHSNQPLLTNPFTTSTHRPPNRKLHTPNSPDCELPTVNFPTPGERTSEGFYCIKGGIDAAIARGLAYAPYADLLWFETSDPSMAEAKVIERAVIGFRL